MGSRQYDGVEPLWSLTYGNWFEELGRSGSSLNSCATQQLTVRDALERRRIMVWAERDGVEIRRLRAMDKFVVRLKSPQDLPPDYQLLPSSDQPKLVTPEPIKSLSLLAAYEIHGKVLPPYKPSLRQLLLSSYSEVGAWRSELRSQGSETQYAFNASIQRHAKRPYVSSIDFDSKGIYLASVTSTGCLSVHEFETLHCSAAKGTDQEMAAFIRHISTDRALEAIRWNPTNQDEVACVGANSSKMYFYDIGCDSFLPSEVLKVKSSHGWGDNLELVGLFDLAFGKSGSSRVLACGRDGNVHIWDRRASKSSHSALPVPSVGGALNSVQLSDDEQMVYSGSEGGFIYAWDLRGGKLGSAFVSSSEGYHEPCGTVKIAAVLSTIWSLRAQTDIGTSAVHAVSLDPSCGHTLAFHLNNGWSGVLDMTSFDVTHIHCPPPPWQSVDGMADQVDSSSGLVSRWHNFGPVVGRRRPVWLTSCPVYVVGSGSDPFVHMLDFTPGKTSRYSVESNRDPDDDHNEKLVQTTLPTSEAVVAIAAHPLNDDLVGGTQGGRLLLLGQKRESFSSGD